MRPPPPMRSSRSQRSARDSLARSTPEILPSRRCFCSTRISEGNISWRHAPFLRAFRPPPRSGPSEKARRPPDPAAWSTMEPAAPWSENPRAHTPRESLTLLEKDRLPGHWPGAIACGAEQSARAAGQRWLARRGLTCLPRSGGAGANAARVPAALESKMHAAGRANRATDMAISNPCAIQSSPFVRPFVVSTNPAVANR